MATQRKTKQAAISATISSTSVSLAFANGKSIYIAFDDLSGDVQRRAVGRAIADKLVDAAAISRDPVTGRSATVEDKYDAVRAVADRLLAGEWSKPRESAGATAGTLLLQALVRIFPKRSPEALKAWLAGKSDEEKRNMQANDARVIDAMAAIRKERAGDTSGMLDELEEPEESEEERAERGARIKKAIREGFGARLSEHEAEYDAADAEEGSDNE